MPAILRRPRAHRRPSSSRKYGLFLEPLETRTVPTGPAWPGLLNPAAALGTNCTLDQAQLLGDLTTAQQLQVVGNIGNGPAGAADVEWYSFTLDNPAHVTLATLDVPAHSSFVSVLSLYNTDFDNTNDPYVPLGYRLLVQDDGVNHGGDAGIDRTLAAGTYFVAVSGSGNRYFHPSIAGSGYAGSTGDYGLLITGQDLPLDPANGPVVLATDLLTYPGFTPVGNNSNGTGILPDAVVGRSPFLIRVDVNEALDPTTINPGQTVQLMDLTTGQPVTLTAYFDASANELKLTPAAPLAPGDYQLTLAGDNSTGAPVIQDLAPNPLGGTAANPSGHDYTYTFRVAGSEGIAASSAVSDGTPGTAHELGDITQAGLVQWAGAIGDDPTDPVPFNPADVDLYHFHVSGAGNFAFQAEVFAGRIGSPLDSEVSLFRLDPADNQLHLIALNDNTLNDTKTFDGSQEPLATDSNLAVGLTEGDYYVAVTGSGYVPAALTDKGLPGPQSVFDPTVPYPFGGSTTGDYVLNLSVAADNTPPQVTSVNLPDGSSLVNGAVLAAPPTEFKVQFSEPVNVAQLALQTFLLTNETKLDAVTIQGPAGTFSPRFAAYLGSASEANFRMYDALPNGVYQLHLSGAHGLTDLAGNALTGNSPSGDYLISFTVNGPVRGVPGDPFSWNVQNQSNIGVLFPDELQHGVTLQRPETTGSGINADSIQIQLLQHKRYVFVLSSSNLPAKSQLTITDASSAPVPARTFRVGGGIVILAVLNPGSYTLHVSGWSPAAGYQLAISIDQALEPVPPLTVGPGPAAPLRSLTGVLPPPDNKTSNSLPAILPAAGTGNDIVSVSLGANGTGSFSNLTGFPAEVLLALEAGQLGGFGGAYAGTQSHQSDVYAQLILAGPDPSFAQLIVQVPVLLHAQDSGATSGFAGPVDSLLQQVVRSLSKFNWEAVVEFLHRLQDWSMEQMLPTPRPNVEPPAGSDLPGDQQLPDATWPDRTEDASFSEAGMQALAVTAALAVLDFRKRRPSKTNGQHDCADDWTESYAL